MSRFDEAFSPLTPREVSCYEMLNRFLDAIAQEGVDTSFFPESAYLVMIDYAKKFAAREEKAA